MAKQINKIDRRVCLLFALVGSLFLTSCSSPGWETEVMEYTVLFCDHDGAVLSAQTVPYGQAAAMPPDPFREGYVFSGWNKDCHYVTADMTITAQYTWTIDPTIMVGSMIAAPGQTVKVPVIIANNPGIAGAKITIMYDSALTLRESESGEAFSVLDYTRSGKYVSPCSFTWDSESGMAMGDGTILWLTFDVSDDVATGKAYAVDCIYREGDIFDEDLNDVTVEVMSGVVTVE